MKVKDLLVKLSELDPDLEIICYCEDENIVAPEALFKLFNIQDVSIVEAEKKKDHNNSPTLKLTKSKISEKVVTIDITSDF